MLVGTAAQLRKMDHIRTVNVADAVLPVSEKVKSLGVILDNQLKFGDHVNSVAKACNYHIWALRHIRHLLTTDIRTDTGVQHRLIQAWLLQRSTLRSPAKYVAVLQRVQNNLARVVLQQPRLTPVKPLLQSLHWLPVIQRIEYKLTILIFKVKTTNTPDYLSRLLMESTTTTSMTLRSASRTMLRPKVTRTCYGGRAFSASAPAIWNALPADFNFSDSCNVFKKRLKHIYLTKPSNSSLPVYFPCLWI